MILADISETVRLGSAGIFYHRRHSTDRGFSGNLHINIVASRWDVKIENVIEPWIYEATGSPSFCHSTLSVNV